MEKYFIVEFSPNSTLIINKKAEFGIKVEPVGWKKKPPVNIPTGIRIVRLDDDLLVAFEKIVQKQISRYLKRGHDKFIEEWLKDHPSKTESRFP